MMTIGQLASAGGVGVETIRYYQRRGLLAVPERGGGARRYGEDALRRLRFVRQAQAAGFHLGDIGELLDLDAVDDRARARELARARLAALDARIAEMERALLEMAPSTGEVTQAAVARLLSTSPEIAAKVLEVVK